LKKERGLLAQRLHAEVLLHNDEKRRREWCEAELIKIMGFMEQQGFKVGPIQYPDWYHQSSAPQQVQSQHQVQQQTYTVGAGSRPQSPVVDYTNQQIASFAAQVNPNQASQNGFNQSQMGHSVHDPRPQSPNPQQIQSTYQIANQGGTQQNFGPYATDASYYQQPGRPQSPNDGFQGMRAGIEQLHQENQMIRNNVSNNYDGQPEDFQTLQQRLQAAEQRARAYEQEMGRWKMEASRRGDYPGILDLLEETERIRVETIKLMKMKETGRLGGNRDFE